MPTFTPKLGLPIPSTGDLPSGPLAVGQLATALDALGVMGGKRRTAASANIVSIESVCVDSQTLAMSANYVFQIEFNLSFTVSVAATDLDMKVRLTSVAGTIVGETEASGPYVSPQVHSKNLIIIYKTGSVAELNYFCGTAVRIGGTGNIQAVVPTSLVVNCIGPNTILGDF